MSENARFLLEKGLLHQIIPLYLLFLASSCVVIHFFLIFSWVFE